MAQIQFPDFMAITVGLVVYLLGESINNRVRPLRELNIPDPVTGGLVFAALTWGLYRAGVAEIGFDTHTRDLLLLMFFTGIGLNARLSDLLRGGRPLAILIGITAVLLLVQMAVGGLGAWIAGLPMGMGAVLGSTALLGGHGTVIAWTPELQARGLEAAPEVGIAMATLALVVASIIGGPMAGALIRRFGLASTEIEAGSVGLAEGYATGEITRNALMRTLLWIFICMILGFFVQRAIAEFGLNLPLFVPCLLTGMLVGNLIPLVPFIKPVSHTPTLSLVSEFALGVFLAVSLMSLRLWQLGGYAGTILAVLTVQTLIAVLAAILLAFRFLGRDYQAAVISSGYASFVIGATPTAIATMTAVTKRHGPCQAAFIVIPLLSALFVDIANALVTQGYLNLLSP
ncbi:sodium/glutamate symporter [Amaricoccus solimangrovi]|uniref:Sodium/glutamate symporter n=1 Tax=Amaricoccus solimangrovi TaxID=2589815 RepID=A0A501WRQ5_9RHOB|nr:sodium/glutamate symporter [Amaricoccus solimangrovi]TPE50764.1 sodium/glutamate symporter [Amaricoccus solimangrovi]